MAAAPASSRRRTLSRSSTSGEAPGMNGWGSVRPRYVVDRSMGSSLSVHAIGAGRNGGGRGFFGSGFLGILGACRRHGELRELLVHAHALDGGALGGLRQLAEAHGVLLLHH